jgi:microcompartment protein CcmL/EutN
VALKTFSALAVVELDDIPTGVVAVDALAKKAPVALLRSGTITRGRYLIVVGGTPAAVEEAYHEGLLAGGGAVVDQLLLADVHPKLAAGILDRRRSPGDSALAVLECPSVASVVLAVERALKGTPVELVEIRLGDSGLDGKGLALLRGELHDVEAAVELAAAAVAERGRALSSRVIPSPHDALLEGIAGSTSFAAAPAVRLDGEEG